MEDKEEIGILRNNVEKIGKSIGGMMWSWIVNWGIGVEKEGNWRMLKKDEVIEGVKEVKKMKKSERIIKKREKIRKGENLESKKLKCSLLKEGLDEEIIKGGLVIDILRRIEECKIIERRMRDIDMKELDKLRNMKEEEGEKKSKNMGEIEVGVGNDDDIVIKKIVGVEEVSLIIEDGGEKRSDEGEKMIGWNNKVEKKELKVKDFEEKRKNGMIMEREKDIGEKEWRIEIEDEDLGIGRIEIMEIGKI